MFEIDGVRSVVMVAVVAVAESKGEDLLLLFGLSEDISDQLEVDSFLLPLRS